MTALTITARLWGLWRLHYLIGMFTANLGNPTFFEGRLHALFSYVRLMDWYMTFCAGLQRISNLLG